MYRTNFLSQQYRYKDIGGIILKATGIVRRIDDLGRIVIPKEIRRTLRIRDGDPLEIYIQNGGEITLKKHSSMGGLSNVVTAYAEILSRTTGHTVCFVDKENVISANGNLKKDYIDKPITEKLLNKLNERDLCIAKKDDNSLFKIIDAEPNYQELLVLPIIVESDVVGGILFLSEGDKLDNLEIKLAKTIAAIISSQIV